MCDGYIMVGVNNVCFWEWLCVVIGCFELVVDLCFESNVVWMEYWLELVVEFELVFVVCGIGEWV